MAIEYKRINDHSFGFERIQSGCRAMYELSEEVDSDGGKTRYVLADFAYTSYPNRRPWTATRANQSRPTTPNGTNPTTNPNAGSRSLTWSLNRPMGRPTCAAWASWRAAARRSPGTARTSFPGNGLHDLNGNGRTTNDEGFVTDGDGYIAIASPDESIPIGTEVDTPWGTAKVYDYNPGESWDCYVSW